MEIEPNKYQEVVFDFIKNGTGNAVIEAVAGSGKTWTIVEATKLIPRNQKAIFVAFNKTIVNELRSKISKNIAVNTLHSEGYRITRSSVASKVEFDKEKLSNVLKRVGKNRYPKKGKFPNEIEVFLSRLIPKIKATMCKLDKELLSELADEFDITGIVIDDISIGIIKEVLEECKKNTTTIDYDDMCWLPVVNEYKDGKKYDWVFIDEVQDLNRTQFELVKLICDKDTRVVAVGDRRQSIYAFRGADINSMDNFKCYFNAEEFPLSICYRCPKTVIELAKNYVPQIEAPEDAPEGKLTEIDIDTAINNLKDGDVVLCRVNSALVSLVFALLRKRKKAIIRGRDIGKSLVKTIEETKETDLSRLREVIRKRRNLEESTIELAKIDSSARKHLSKAIRMVDTYNTILEFASNVEDVKELKKVILEIFSNDKEGIVCSSVHKAKGLGFKDVYILYFNTLMPLPKVCTAKGLQQENNIIYVAVTRAKEELNLIMDDRDVWSY